MPGSGGGASTTAVGIFASGRLNITIRHCTIRGFQIGILVEGGSGYLVEDNVLDQSRSTGIGTIGDGSVVRRNIVTNGGGAPGGGSAVGIYAAGDVTDNIVDGIVGVDSVVNFTAFGIYSPPDSNFGIVIQGNRIRNLTPKGTGEATGITSNGSGAAVRDNAIGQPSSTPGTGIVCADNTSHVHDNVILRYGTGVASACDKAGGNSIN